MWKPKSSRVDQELFPFSIYQYEMRRDPISIEADLQVISTFDSVDNY
jgi:hypothetical protein